MSRNALSQEEVIRYIEQNSTAKLLPPFYKNNRSKLKLECECGNIFYTTFSSFKKQGKTRCDECVKNSAGKKSKEINSVQKELIAKGFQIVDGIYKNNKSKLLLKDIEGYFYLSSLVTIRVNNINILRIPYTEKDVKLLILDYIDSRKLVIE